MAVMPIPAALSLLSALSIANVAYVAGEDVAWRPDPKKTEFPLAFLRINAKVEIVSRDKRPWIKVRSLDAVSLENARRRKTLPEEPSRDYDKTIGFIHESMLSDEPTTTDAALTAALEAKRNKRLRKALVYTVRAVAIAKNGRAALSSLRDRLRDLEMNDAARRVDESVRGAIEYVAVCDGGELYLVAEQGADGAPRAIALAADLPAWKRVLLRSDAESRRWVSVDNQHSVEDATIRWHRTSSDYNSVSLAQITTPKPCSKDLYATTTLDAVPVEPTDIHEATSVADEIVQTGGIHRNPNLYVSRLGAKRVLGGVPIVDVRFGVHGPADALENDEDLFMRTAWTIVGAETTTTPSTRCTCDTTGDYAWYRLNDGHRFRIGGQTSGGMWNAPLVLIVSADDDGAVRLQTIPLETGGC